MDLGEKLNSGTNNPNYNELDIFEETRLAVEKIVLTKKIAVELIKRNIKIRQMQYNFIQSYNVKVKQFGQEPEKKLRLYPS